MIRLRSTHIFFLAIFSASLYLFYPSLNYYFFQDDWFVLNWVRTGDLASFLSFRTDIIYWRPVSMPIFFKIGLLLFDLKPFGYHLAGFILHLINAFLVFVLFTVLKFSRATSLLIAFLYATASFHFIPLSWVSTTSYIIGPTFILLTIILFLRNKIITAFLFFLLSIASSELSLSVIPIILILSREKKATFRKLLPFLVLGFVYLLIRFLIYPAPAVGQYQLSLTPKILTKLFWYFAWLFNTPEMVSSIFFFSKLKSSIVSSLIFFKYLVLPLVMMTIFFIAALLKVKFSKLLVGVLWFTAGLLPVLFFQKHIYPMYLVIASLGIFYILAQVLDLIRYRTILVFTVSFLWFLSSLLTISFYRHSHWVVNEQAVSKAYIDYARQVTTIPSSGSIFVFKSANIAFAQKHKFVLVEGEDTLRLALNGNDAMQVVYDDPSLASFYVTHQEKEFIPAKAQIFEISPRD